MYLIPALGRQRQSDLWEFEASLCLPSARTKGAHHHHRLAIRASSGTGTKATEKPCLEKPEKKRGKLVI